MIEKPVQKTIAIVGGGRWAKVYLAVFWSLDLPLRYIVVSRSNTESLSQFCGENGHDVLLVPTIDELLKHHAVSAAVIVNAARAHAETGAQLIKSGISVMIEKPVALEETDSENLCQLAIKHNVQVVPALTFLSCSYLENFAQKVREHSEQPTEVYLDWHDPHSETRYGEVKSYDPGISVAQDVMPHIWSILSTVLGGDKSDTPIYACSTKRGGRKVSIEMSFSGTTCHIDLERDAPSRRRNLTVVSESGYRLELDFTSEPGTIKLGTQSICADTNWHTNTVRPIQGEIERFIRILDCPPDNGEAQLAATSSASLVERSDAFLKEQQKAWLATCPSSDTSDDIVYAISEVAAPELYRKRLLIPGDRAALGSHIQDLMQNITAVPDKTVSWLSSIEHSLQASLSGD